MIAALLISMHIIEYINIVHDSLNVFYKEAGSVRWNQKHVLIICNSKNKSEKYYNVTTLPQS